MRAARKLTYVRHPFPGQPIKVHILDGHTETTATVTPQQAMRLASDLIQAALRELAIRDERAI